MKLTCDLCGGVLQMNAGGKDATCKTCGLCYPIAVLREKLGLGAAAQPQEKPAEPEKVIPVVEEVIETPVAPVVEETKNIFLECLSDIFRLYTPFAEIGQL